MSVKLLTEHHLEFLNLTGGYTGSSESTLVKVPHCWKSHVAAHLYLPCLSMLQTGPFHKTVNSQYSITVIDVSSDSNV